MASSTRERRPTFELADMVLPYQGDWTVEEYLKLDTNRLIEYTDGFLEFLPMPDEIHQDVLEYIFLAVKAILRNKGAAKFAPFKVRVGKRRFREPDLSVLLDKNDPRRGQEYWSGADVVFEIVSPEHPERDYKKKRKDYAKAGITEFWIVDPHAGTVTVLELAGGEYRERGPYRARERATSRELRGLSIDVTDCFATAARVASTRRPPIDEA